MRVVHERGGAECVMSVVSYIIIVISKYVQMMSSYHINNRDVQGLESTFQWFNRCFSSYQSSYREITNQELRLDQTTVNTFEMIQKKLDKDEEVREEKEKKKEDVTDKQQSSASTASSASASVQRSASGDLDPEVADMLKRLKLNNLRQIFT